MYALLTKLWPELLAVAIPVLTLLVLVALRGEV
jgi:hypothetical protein